MILTYRLYLGQGFGLKIIGGKPTGEEGEVGAFVAAIQRGSAADRLHGELQEGQL